MSRGHFACFARIAGPHLDPGSERRGLEIRKREEQVGQVALDVDHQDRDLCAQGFNMAGDQHLDDEEIFDDQCSDDNDFTRDTGNDDSDFE